jgi:site-specific DNA-methyltransferase (cytosine-N4-specific)
VRVSNQESDTRYAAIKKNICARDVYFGFQRAVQGIADTLRQRDYPLHPVRIIEADTLSLSPQTVGHPIGFVITSPP